MRKSKSFGDQWNVLSIGILPVFCSIRLLILIHGRMGKLGWIDAHVYFMIITVCMGESSAEKLLI